MRKAAPPKRYAAYLRCSTDDQKEGDFTTIDVQRTLNERYVQERGGVLVTTYSDEGRSGSNLLRPGWKQLLASAQAKQFDAVIVTYMSRLGRGNAFVIAEWELSKAGVIVEMVKERFTDDLAGYMTRSMTNVMDGMYAQMVRSWTKTKMQQMVEQGYHTGGVRLFGYETESIPGMQPTTLPGGKVKPAPKRLVPHLDEAPLVHRAFEIFVETSNMGEVQRYLRREAPSRQWAIERVSDLLRNERYRGVARFGEHVNPTAHEALISESLWDEVRALLHAPERQLHPRSLGWSKGRERDR